MNTVYAKRYLAVDSDIEFAKRESEVWMKNLGIGMDRVDTMTEAMQRLLISKYLYVGINSDAVDFTSLLKPMRSITNTPILIATNNFTTEKEVAALGGGADLYARYHTDGDGNIRIEGNIASVLAWIDKTTERNRMKKPVQRIIFCGNMLVMADHKMVFCNDAEIALTSKEYGILLYLLEHRSMTVSYQQISYKLWGNASASDESIRQIIDRLRKKLMDVGFCGAEIANYKGMGTICGTSPARRIAKKAELNN